MAGSSPDAKHPFKQMRQRMHLLCRRWIDPVMPVTRLAGSVSGYVTFVGDWFRYSSLPGSEPLRFADGYPCVYDRTGITPYDAHYFYQDIWAFKAIKRSLPEYHVDVASRVIFVGMLTAITKVVFIDIRPLEAALDGLESRAGSVLEMPFEDNSVASLSCLHAAEHVGLGRYGDPLDPEGTRKTSRELARVLAPGGDLYFAVPVGKPRVCFNAHRIHAPEQILEYFRSLRLAEFSVIDDCGRFQERVEPVRFSDADYACGLFHFTKES